MDGTIPYTAVDKILKIPYLLAWAGCAGVPGRDNVERVLEPRHRLGNDAGALARDQQEAPGCPRGYAPQEYHPQGTVSRDFLSTDIFRVPVPHPFPVSF
jgi:hypothetical protein